MREAIKTFWADRKGATAVEYAILVAILGLGLFGIAKPFANLIYAMWLSISGAFAAL